MEIKIILCLLLLMGCSAWMPTPNRPPTEHERRTIQLYKETGQEHRIPDYVRELKLRDLDKKKRK